MNRIIIFFILLFFTVNANAVPPVTHTPLSTKVFNDVIFYFNFDEIYTAQWNGTTGEVKDHSGNNYNGKATLALSVLSGGKFYASYVADAVTGHYVDIGSNESFAPSQAKGFSYTFWAKGTDTTHDMSFFAKSADGSGGIYCMAGFTADAITFMLENPSPYPNVLQNWSNCKALVSNGNWHFFCFVALRTDSSATKASLQIWMDGVQVDDKATGGAFPGLVYETDTFRIGQYQGSNRSWDGSIDDFAMHNHGLTQAEILFIYYDQIGQQGEQ